MKKIIFVLLFLVFAPSVVRAQEATLVVINQTLINEEGISPRLIFDGWMFSKFNERLGGWVFSWIEKDYASVIAGPLYDFPFGKNGDGLIEIGGAIGVETFKGDHGNYDPYFRYAGFVSLTYKKLSVAVNYENGGSHEKWLRFETDWSLGERSSLGVYHQTGDGWGPRGSYFGSKRPIQVWVAPMYLNHEWGVLTGLEYRLK